VKIKIKPIALVLKHCKTRNLSSFSTISLNCNSIIYIEIHANLSSHRASGCCRHWIKRQTVNSQVSGRICLAIAACSDARVDSNISVKNLRIKCSQFIYQINRERATVFFLHLTVVSPSSSQDKRFTTVCCELIKTRRPGLSELASLSIFHLFSVLKFWMRRTRRLQRPGQRWRCPAVTQGLVAGQPDESACSDTL